MSQFPISVDEAAMSELRRILAKRAQPGQFFRVGVKGGGCSGFEYLLKLEDRQLPIDSLFEAGGVKIVCDAKSAEFLAGSVLTYTGNLLGGGFRFDNPNAQRSCGCGTSFTPKAN